LATRETEGIVSTACGVGEMTGIAVAPLSKTGFSSRQLLAKTTRTKSKTKGILIFVFMAPSQGI
jgi:hypothetical protein